MNRVKLHPKFPLLLPALGLAFLLACQNQSTLVGELAPEAQSEPMHSAKRLEEKESSPPIVNLEEWLTGFHNNPNPDRVPEGIWRISREGYFEKADHIAVGFLAEIFRLYPEQVEDWIYSLLDLPDEHLRLVCISVWRSQIPSWATILERLVPVVEGDFRDTLDRCLNSKPTPLMEAELSPSLLDTLWVSYFASGNFEYLERIVSALSLSHEEEDGFGNLMVYGAAKWSLASNASQHIDIRDWLGELVDESEGAQREELLQILSEL